MRAINRAALAAVGIVLALIAFVAINTWATLELRSDRVDLTQNRQYTLSPATRTLLGKVEEPITLRLYMSAAIRDANPFLWSYAQRVRDLLRTYAELSRGRIVLEVIDPLPFSTEEDRAVGFGLQPLSLGANAAAAYLGIVGTNSTDDVDLVPTLSPEREPFLEYDLTRLVYNLAQPDKPVLAVVTGLPINGDPAMQYRPWAIYQQLTQFFEVRVIGGDVAAFDPDVDLLLLVFPDSLSEKTQLAIDQFVLKGGKMLAFLDPHSEASAVRQRQQIPGPASASLDTLMAAWGVQLAPGEVVGDPAYARQVQFPSGGRQQVVDYLPWMALRGDALARDQVITSELDRLNVASIGFLTKREGGTTQLVPLLTSSAEAAAIPVEQVASYPDPLRIIRSYKRGGTPLVMAARVTGPVKTAFPELPAGVEAPADRLMESRQPVDLVIVADTDLLDDRSWLAQQLQVPVADNANLVANALDYLAGSDALASLRGRDVAVRPFTRVEQIRKAAELTYRAEEQDLLGRLEELQKKLTSPDVAEGELEAARAQLLDTRQRLREVRYDLGRDIDRLRDGLRLFNIAAVPLLVALVAIGLALANRAATRRRVRSAG